MPAETRVSVFAGGVPSALQRFEIRVLVDVGCGLQQPKAHFFTATPARRELLADEERCFVVLAMLMVYDKVKSPLGNTLAGLIGWFRHKYLADFRDRPRLTAMRVREDLW
jgi:hypothetical protein